MLQVEISYCECVRSLKKRGTIMLSQKWVNVKAYGEDEQELFQRSLPEKLLDSALA
jgi:hypothetical protein